MIAFAHAWACRVNRCGSFLTTVAHIHPVRSITKRAENEQKRGKQRGAQAVQEDLYGLPQSLVLKIRGCPRNVACDLAVFRP